MTAFGGIFGLPEIEGVDETGENGEPGRILGLDLDSGVVRIRPAQAAPAQAAPADPAPEDEPEG